MKTLVCFTAVALLCAAHAEASQMSLAVSGTITQQHSGGALDSNLSVGSVLTVTAQFDSSMVIPWGNTGYEVVGLYGQPFRVDAPGVTWFAFDSEQDGTPVYEQYDDYVKTIVEGRPAIVFQGDKVVGMDAWLLPAGSNRAPELGLGSGVMRATDYRDDEAGTDSYLNLFAPILTNQFIINPPNGLWGNHYSTPGFTGVWDFAGATLASAAPEPASWALMLLGFGAVGFMLRRRIRFTRQFRQVTTSGRSGR